VLLVMVPLAMLNAWPLAAGCICADGHYEPVCHAAECRTGMSDCGCACCAHHNCCSGKACCHRSAKSHEQMLGQHVGDSGCCTPLIHQATPTVVNTSPLVDGQHVMALVMVPIDLPYFGEALKIRRQTDFDTGRPPNDLVITLQRLVI